MRYRKPMTSLVLGLLLPVIAPCRELTALDINKPIRKDIKEAITLGVHALTNSFDRDRDNEPFFWAIRRADGTGEFGHLVNIGIPHVVGRCLWATMLAEETTGIPFPEESLKILTRYCQLSFDNNDYLNSYNDPKRGNRRFVEFENMREGLFGLVALIRGRDSMWARETAHRMLLTLQKITSAQGHLSIGLAQDIGIAPYSEGLGQDARTNGRLVDPLIEYYRSTKDPLALKLAGLYSKATLETAFTVDGKFAPVGASGGHIHSITSSLSGITSYAALTNDRGMWETCRRIMDKGVPEYFSSWGWGDEVMADHPANIQSRGEINQTGDVIRTALLLGKYVSPNYYDLAERYLRSMLLPAQLREENLAGFLRENTNPKGDRERGVLNRSVGGYGFPLPNDRMREGDWPIFTLDITSGAVHALCEAWLYRAVSDENSIRVNLLFDFKSSEIEIHSSLPTEGRLEFTPATSKVLLIRIPEWVDYTTIKVTIEGQEQSLTTDNGYVKFARLPLGRKGAVTFRVPCREDTETVDGIKYQTKWIGNQIVEIKPRGEVSPLPF